MNAKRFIAFLRRLPHDETRSIHLVVDGHPVHRSKAVKRFEERTGGRLEIRVPPSHSPQFNPIEQVWNHVKNHQLGRKVIAGPDHLKTTGAVGAAALAEDPTADRQFLLESRVSPYSNGMNIILYILATTGG